MKMKAKSQGGTSNKNNAVNPWKAKTLSSGEVFLSRYKSTMTSHEVFSMSHSNAEMERRVSFHVAPEDRKVKSNE
jgi:hypothetical protein